MVDHTVSNSYITTTELADAYFLNDPRQAAIAFLALTTDQKAWYLKRATRNIDQLGFVGYKCESAQVLQFPRKFVTNPEENSPFGEILSIDQYGYAYQTEVPDEIENATCEEALALYSSLASTSPISESSLQAAGVQSFSLGKLSMSFAPGSASRYGSMKSNEAYDMILESGYLDMCPLIQ
jgi:hypothetical protein